jgi:hypothetical protein
MGCRIRQIFSWLVLKLTLPTIDRENVNLSVSPSALQEWHAIANQE